MPKKEKKSAHALFLLAFLKKNKKNNYFSNKKPNDKSKPYRI